MDASFFMSYAFKAHSNGLFGTLEGQKIYSVEYYEEVEKLIADCMKVLKTGSDAAVTFESYEGYETIELCRIFVDAGNTCNYVYWQRDAAGGVYETILQEVELNRKNVKRLVLEAISKFRERAA